MRRKAWGRAYAVRRIADARRSTPTLELTMRVAHSDGYIQGSGVRIRATHAVIVAHLIGDRVVVVYEWMAFEPGTPARNLYCYGLNGEELWRAEDIGMGATDAYTAVLKEEPLWVGNFAGFDCQIDVTSGKVLERTFTK